MEAFPEGTNGFLSKQDGTLEASFLTTQNIFEQSKRGGRKSRTSFSSSERHLAWAKRKDVNYMVGWEKLVGTQSRKAES